MTHFSDGLRVGKVFDRTFQGDNSNPGLKGPGGAISPIFVYNIVPLTLQDNNYAASQTPGGAGNLTLTAGTGVTAGTVNGVAVLKADVARCVRITSAADDSGNTFTVTGYDAYNQAQTETITGPNTTVVSGAKSFLSITSVAIGGAAVGAIKVGTGDKFGLPYAAASANYVRPKWAGVLAADAGTFVAADATTATAATGDVRGTYLPTSASNGSRRLTIEIFLNDTNTSAGLYGVTPA